MKLSADSDNANMLICDQYMFLLNVLCLETVVLMFFLVLCFMWVFIRFVEGSDDELKVLWNK